ncbi:MAG TPA: sulfatase-like hydrolase/transferase [Puia sp.]|nr:sulfatase-like hydrolase/transferase [Puia sp.]
MNWQKYILDFFTYGILFYSFLTLFFYLFIGFYSTGEIRKYLRKNSFADYRILAASDHLPGISILAPAYNESVNIIENVRSMLSVNYNKLEVIIINDGSTDDTLKKLIMAYDLYKTNIFINEQIPTKKIRGIYKSNNPVLDKLIVVDKVNGGKADALNVGVNLSRHNYIVCLDVDCVLEQDALLKMIKPFLEETKVRVIASGGVIRIANNCKIENGRLMQINLPKNILQRIQIVEYIRAFLLGRMAWSRLNGLLLISGAFGAFDKEIVIKCGGYNFKTVGEDIELIVRMRRYMEENDLPYKVTFIPDPLCWTEVPSNYRILGRQRNRWTRGTIETLRKHRVMFFNPRYGLLGMISYPYWFFFEFLGPIIEFTGMIFFLVFAFLGLIQWSWFFILLVCILSFGFLYSAFAILMEVLTYNQYKGKKDIFKLLIAAFLEPFIFHSFVVWSAIKGNIDYLRKRNKWGEMTRQGLNSQPLPIRKSAPVIVEARPKKYTGPLFPKMVLQGVKALPKGQVDSMNEKNKGDLMTGQGLHLRQQSIAVSDPVIFDAEPKNARGLLQKLLQAVKEAAVYSIVLLASMLIIKLYELIRNAQQFGVPKGFLKAVGFGIINDISFTLNLAIVPVGIYVLLFLLSKKIARFFFLTFSLVLIAIHAMLAEYFLETLVPLGADLLKYSLVDIKQTIGAAGVSLTFIGAMILMLAFIIWLFVIIPKKLHLSTRLSCMLLGVFAIAAIVSTASITNKWKPGQEFSNNISLNKSYFFYSSCYRSLSANRKDDLPLDGGVTLANATAFNYIDEQHYPFLHTVDPNADVLSPFFNKTSIPPNIVFIVVEGLGSAFSNKDAYLGSFTPFLDSLSGKSLYWKNFLSAGGRTFAMPPSIFSSLPFGKNGFLELGDRMKTHLSLFNVLQNNGYSSNFFYGGNAGFDNMNTFMKLNRTNVYDEKTFSAAYTRMPASNSGFSWGFGDEEVFKRYSEATSKMKSPTCNVLLTLSTHSPFLIKDEDKYLQIFEQRMQTLEFSEAQKEEHRHYKSQYASILYLDNSIRNFINGYSKRTDFGNTIFIITGDHRMPEIPMSTKIDRYHVPLIIFSPLLKRSQVFGAVCTHFDITPSLLSLFSHKYNFKVPTIATWMGQGLDTAHAFRNIGSYPLMHTKNEVTDYLMDGYMLNGEDLYKLNDNMDLEPVNDEVEKGKLMAAFTRFKQKNNKFANNNLIMPDSLLIR